MAEFELPEGWIQLEIGDISEVIAGGTPNASDLSNFAEPGSAIAWITPADLSGYKQPFIAHGSRDLSQKGYESSSAKLLPAGTLLFSSRAPIGYVAIAANPISTNQGFKNFVISQHISSKYVYHFLKCIRDLAESRGTGTTFKELSGANAKKLPFILIPLAEQHEIAARLDTLLAQVDATKARLDGIPALLKRFRQSVLAAVASESLAERAKITNILEVSESIFDGPFGSNLKSDDYTNFGVRVVRLENIGHLFFLGKKEVFISKEKYASLEKHTLCSEDILFSSFVDEEVRVCLFPQNAGLSINKADCFCIRLNKAKCLPKFLAYRLASHSTYLTMQKLAHGATRPRINLKQLKQFEFLLPPLEEQSEIVARVEALFAFADLIEARVKAAQAQVNMLTQAILAKAFRGELTAAWRAQHPELISGENSAEALLARIQAERGQSEKPAKKAGKKVGPARKNKSTAPVESEGEDLPAGQLHLPGLLLPEAVEAGR